MEETKKFKNLTSEDIKVGSIYRGKKVRTNPFSGLTDDRIILYINPKQTKIQYDSYFVDFGRQYPTTTMDKFLRWVKEEVQN